jgi:catechol 2,3-dioxygenase-like lactoylglutathione lyase family enzyme
MLMLQKLPTMAVLPAKDLERARAFYRDTLGLEPAEEETGGLRYNTGGGTSFLLYETDNAGSAKNTQMGWVTEDLDAEVADLRGRGVVFADYDFPGLKTENGIATTDGERTAWFLDSEGNILAVTERIAK